MAAPSAHCCVRLKSLNPVRYPRTQQVLFFAPEGFIKKYLICPPTIVDCAFYPSGAKKSA